MMYKSVTEGKLNTHKIMEIKQLLKIEDSNYQRQWGHSCLFYRKNFERAMNRSTAKPGEPRGNGHVPRITKPSKTQSQRSRQSDQIS